MKNQSNETRGEAVKEAPMYVLRISSYGGRCDKCRHTAAYVFKGVRYSRWQKRCMKCAERMVREGKAVHA